MHPPVLALSLSLDTLSLEPDQTTRAHIVAEIRANAPGIERARPPMSVVFAIDASRSMSGPPLEQAVSSIHHLTALLEPSDRVGVVSFSGDAREVAALVPATAEAKRRVAQASRQIAVSAGTNIESGLRRAASLMPTRRPHERQIILLLSDGQPTMGLTSPDELASLARSYRPDIAISTLGYGAHHSEDPLIRVSDAAGGRYHFVPDPKVCVFEFAQALGLQGDVVADAIELSIAPERGVEILRFLGSPDLRFVEAGLKIAVPDLLDGATHLLVAEAAITAPREAGITRIARATLTYRRAGEAAPMSYRDGGAREARREEATLSVPVGFAPKGPAPDVRFRVLRVRAEEVRAEARALADRRQFPGAEAVLRALVRAIDAEPGFVAGDGTPLAGIREQLVDDADAMQRVPDAEQYKTFRRAQSARPFSTPMPSDRSTPSVRMFLSAVAGPLPPARLLVIAGHDAGKHFALSEPRLVIGRGTDAHIILADRSVSWMHAALLARDGRFYVQDLGSTNATTVNGERLDGLRELHAGDVLSVGATRMLYEESARR